MKSSRTRESNYVSGASVEVTSSSSALVIGPLNLSLYPKRTVYISNEGEDALRNLQIQLGPTSEGPWFDEDISATSPLLTTLGAGIDGFYRLDKADPYLRVLAQASTSTGTTLLARLAATS